MTRTNRDTAPIPATSQQVAKLTEKMNRTRAVAVSAAATVAGLLALVIVLWGIHRSDVAALQQQLQLRSQDRITSQQVMHLLEMHSSQPHSGAVTQEHLRALERRAGQ